MAFSVTGGTDEIVSGRDRDAGMTEFRPVAELRPGTELRTRVAGDGQPQKPAKLSYASSICPRTVTHSPRPGT
jgi:hypothetical protein